MREIGIPIDIVLKHSRNVEKFGGGNINVIPEGINSLFKVPIFDYQQTERKVFCATANGASVKTGRSIWCRTTQLNWLAQ